MNRVDRWAVFLDREGVITDPFIQAGVARSPLSASELVLLPGAVEATRSLRAMGALVFIVTNQPDVARGRLEVVELQAMNAVLLDALAIDAIRVCPHDVIDVCDCRKPRPGMLTSLADEFDIDLARSVMVGDRWVDIQAGRLAGAQTILVEYPHSWKPTAAGSPPVDLRPDAIVPDVSAAVSVVASTRDQRI
jgi:D-glycero-D-manno-heptose 1,7-bisphosphate phosphatase